ncbi:MAG: hypothetical protein KKB20_23030 [Proteobacteria bacterium]|nr:hypothetical protein [Pseudomonadota bacterium]
MGKSDKIASCRLCGRNEPLVNSHIIPRFFFREMTDDKGQPFRYHIVHAGPDPSIKSGQGGIKEPLLCKDCDNKVIGSWETYASQVIFSGLPSTALDEVFPNTYKLTGIDYNKFKLFQLSLLWRSSITNREGFRSVNLRKKHENIIREMLLNNDPGAFNQYGCLMYMIQNGGVPFDEIIRADGASHIMSHKVQRFIIGALGWVFFVSSHRVPDKISNWFLSQEGELYIFTIEANKIGILIESSQILNTLLYQGK